MPDIVSRETFNHKERVKFMSEKKRYDYSLIGLAKEKGLTTFDNKGVGTLPKESVNHLANYGLFVLLSRTLAGHEKDSDIDKKALVQNAWDWLAEGMPAKAKAGRASIKQATINMLKVQLATASKVEQKVLQSIIDKMESEAEEKE